MLRIGILLFVALAFVGCSTQYLEPEPGIDGQPGIVFEPPIGEIRTTELARIPFPPRLPPVAIVLTNKQPAYSDIARELTRHFKKYKIYDLSESGQVPVSVLRAINDSNPGAVVAIGLRAARSSVAMAEKPVVFSQVFNYQEHDLLQENSRGVAVLAPLDAQLAAWKDIDPTVTRIGVIVAREDVNMDDVEKDTGRRTSVYGSISTGGRVSIGIGFLLSPFVSGGSEPEPVRYEVELIDGGQMTIYHNSRDFEVDDCVEISVHPDEKEHPPTMKRNKGGC